MQIIPTDDGSPTLLNDHGVTYHSRQGAEAESRHVYIQASNLAQRLATPQSGIHVLEVGLGTGLNFILTATLAAQYPHAHLHYTAYEPHPVSPEMLHTFYAHMPHLCGEWTEILTQSRCQGTLHNISWTFHTQAWPDAGQHMPQDVIFYDAFGPQDAPLLWTSDALEPALRLLKPDGCLVTFSVSGNTERLLRQLGFPFSRPQGFGYKRQMLIVQAPPLCI